MTEFNLSFSGSAEKLTISPGNILFIVGANGVGKSSLMHVLAQNNRGKTRRITAHRQVWFNTDTVDLTPATRLQTMQNIASGEHDESSRYKDDYAYQRGQVTIYDLIESENFASREIADAARSGNMDIVAELASKQSPISKMNDILKISNLNFKLEVDKNSSVVAKRENYPTYSIAQLSDGERNALLMIANVLTADPDTLILLDEPERHLHRSIVSPLISTLLAYRDDCAFVISTHDVTLPHDQRDAAALLIRKYNFASKSWVVDYIEKVKEMDEQTSSAILGARRKIVFTEGLTSSLDLQIYQILFPDITIKPLGSCVEVEKVVKGIRESNNSHWITAYGIIDRDNRSTEECLELEKFGVIAIDQYSIESLYYHPTVIKLILHRVSTINDLDADNVLEEITTATALIMQEHKDRMAARMVERTVKDELNKKSPNWKKILEGGVDITYSTAEVLKIETERLQSYIDNRDLAKIICRYPVRETGTLEIISKKALFPSREKYEQAVRKALIESEEFKTTLKVLLEPVTSNIESPEI